MSTVSILRQAVTVKRHSIANDHDGLVSTLTELFDRQNRELKVVAMERLFREE